MVKLRRPVVPRAIPVKRPRRSSRLVRPAVCPSCGCSLAHDDRSPVCSPCQRSYRDRRDAGYRPQHDPTLRAVVLCTLMEHEGEWVNLYQALGMWPAGLEEWIAVQCHVRHWRRHGHSIAARHHAYRYRGCCVT